MSVTLTFIMTYRSNNIKKNSIGIVFQWLLFKICLKCWLDIGDVRLLVDSELLCVKSIYSFSCFKLTDVWESAFKQWLIMNVSCGCQVQTSMHNLFSEFSSIYWLKDSVLNFHCISSYGSRLVGVLISLWPFHVLHYVF